MGGLSSVTSFQSKIIGGFTVTPISGSSGVGVSGTVDSTVKVSSKVLVPSLADTVWSPDLLIGTLKAAIKIPIEFSEMYVIKTQEAVQQGVPKIIRTLLTRNTGKYQAKTRMGKNGLFEMYEPADLGAMMRKAGYSTENKPFLTGE